LSAIFVLLKKNTRRGRRNGGREGETNGQTDEGKQMGEGESFEGASQVFVILY